MYNLCYIIIIYLRNNWSSYFTSVSLDEDVMPPTVVQSADARSQTESVLPVVAAIFVFNNQDEARVLVERIRIRNSLFSPLATEINTYTTEH